MLLLSLAPCSLLPHHPHRNKFLHLLSCLFLLYHQKFLDVLNQATKESSRGFTVSDLLSNWDELSLIKRREQTENYSNEPSPQPRRCQSMLDFGQRRRDASLPPTIPEGEEKKEEEPSEVAHLQTPRTQHSPKRRVPPHESLSEVQAYTLLDGQDAVQEIRS